MCVCVWLSVSRPTKQANMAQGRVFGRSRRRAVPQTRLAGAKMPRVPSTLTEKGHLRNQAINLALPRWVRAWRHGLMRLEESVRLTHKTQLLG